MPPRDSFQSSDNPSIKCMIVGEKAVGKTSMLMGYATNIFTSDYDQSAFDSYVVTVMVGDNSYQLELVDIAGQVRSVT